MDKEERFLTISDLKNGKFPQVSIDEKFIEQLRKVYQRQIATQHLIGTENEILTTWASFDAVGIILSVGHIEFPNRYIDAQELPKFLACSKVQFRNATKELEKLGYLEKRIEKKGAAHLIEYVFYSCPSKKIVAKIINGD